MLSRGLTHSICTFDSSVIIFTRLNSMSSNDLHGSSVLRIDVYGRRIFARDEYIDGAKERIELLVSDGTTGSQSISPIDGIDA
jgi:hypothetical protein